VFSIFARTVALYLLTLYLYNGIYLLTYLRAGADEVRELNDQLSDREHRMHDLSTLVKRLETEKQELQSAIEEADSTLEQGDSKLQQAIADLTEQRAETERRLNEKDSEFETTRHVSSGSFATM